MRAVLWEVWAGCPHPARIDRAKMRIAAFLAKLASKNQSVAQRSQASAAVGLLLESAPEPGAARLSPTATPTGSPRAPLNSQAAVLSGYGDRGLGAWAQVAPVPPQTPRPAPQASAPPATRQKPETALPPENIDRG